MPKILFYDLETSPSLGYTWRKYDQTVMKFERETAIMSVAYKWAGEKTQVKQLCDYPEYHDVNDEDAFWDDRQLSQFLFDLMDEADVVVGHNVKKFDNKIAHTQFFRHSLGVPSPYITIDTLKVARKHFRCMSNKLGDLGEMLGLGGKQQHEGISLWFKCMKGDLRAWERMRRYARRDVVLLEKVYRKLRPYIEGYHVGSLTGDEFCCPVCGSKKLHKRGFSYTQTYTYQRYQCTSCGKWSKSRFSEKRDNPKNRGIN